MSNGLYIKDGERLSVDIERLQETRQGQVITSTLLDGSFHIQTVGNARLQVVFDCYSTVENKSKIDRLYFEGALVTVKYNEKEYNGRIEKQPSWEYVVNDETENTNKFFHSSVTVACSEVIE